MIRYASSRHTQRTLDEGDFKCAHCGQLVLANPQLSGVHHRNHCPCCLWSRHMDLHKAGDRLAACRSPMQPTALTLKRAYKRYGSENYGELMLVHICLTCRKVSINRIAADDDNERLFMVYQESTRNEQITDVRFAADGIRTLTRKDWRIVQARLYGQN